MHDLHPERAGRQDVGNPRRPLHQRDRLRIVEKLIHAERERGGGIRNPVKIKVVKPPAAGQWGAPAGDAGGSGEPPRVMRAALTARCEANGAERRMRTGMKK